MPKITDKYMNDKYKKFYASEFRKELILHLEYTKNQIDLLQERLTFYCNQNSIDQDITQNKFKLQELQEYLKDTFYDYNYNIGLKNSMDLYFNGIGINSTTKPNFFSSNVYKNIKLDFNYINNDYKKIYRQELKKELKFHPEYDEEQINQLRDKLMFYCNQKSIYEDYKSGEFSIEELKQYIRASDNDYNNYVKKVINIELNNPGKKIIFNMPSSVYKNIEESSYENALSDFNKQKIVNLLQKSTE